MGGFLSHKVGDTLTIERLLRRLKEVYMENIGIQYMHIDDQEKKNWIRERFETTEKFTFTKNQKWLLLEEVMNAELFEKFCATKFSSIKRFGLEGCEALIPSLNIIIDELTNLNNYESNNFVIGMAHRGRLNVLFNIVKKKLSDIFKEFQELIEQVQGSGDVKYHLGLSQNIKDKNNKPISISLVANPSHLEAVNPVIVGKTKAKQYFYKDLEKKKVVPILIHGDAAFSGQGINYETFELSKLENYDVGGTIHVVINNQIGFTTSPIQGRSTPYCTDIAKMLSIPIFHVNADDIESVAFVSKIAGNYIFKLKLNGEILFIKM
jgi:2-oxoglutarate dehydrogenase E1 component